MPKAVNYTEADKFIGEFERLLMIFQDHEKEQTKRLTPELV